MLYPYFIQNLHWVVFWKKANNQISKKEDHQFLTFETDNLNTFVFEYPYLLGGKFWYISKGPTIKDSCKLSFDDQSTLEILKNEFKLLVSNIVKNAKEQGIKYIKADFDDTFSQIIGFANINIYKQFINSNTKLKVTKTDKKIQFLTSTYNFINWEALTLNNEKNIDNLENFYDATLPVFWSNCNEKIRRYTRKVLKLKNENGTDFWNYSFEKTPENFDKFYKIHIETTKRQNFPTQPKSYLEDLFFQDFTKIIIINDEKGVPHCVWLGIMLNGQLTYLLGGNTDESFKNWAQYLVHILALKICFDNKIFYYDMGGYDENEGYGKFKDGYKGIRRDFIGVLDIIIDPVYYTLVNWLLVLKKIVER